MNNKIKSKNYSELKAYLGDSDETKVTLKNLIEILKRELAVFDQNSIFSMLDVGCSDGELTLPLIDEIRKQFSSIKLVAVEPEEPAFIKLRNRTRNKKYVKSINSTIQEFLSKKENKRDLFNFILFSQCWYHFPRKDWNYIFVSCNALLKRKGLIIIILDSYQGEAYELKDLITDGRADTLEYGDLFSAEDIENFLNNQKTKFSVKSFPIYIQIRNDEKKVNNIVKYLAFLYRTYPYRILPNNKIEILKFLENKRKNGSFLIENRIKAVIIRK